VIPRNHRLFQFFLVGSENETKNKKKKQKSKTQKKNKKKNKYKNMILYIYQKKTSRDYSNSL
jgi:hypothetical protein